MNNTPSLLGEPFFVNLSSPVFNPKVVGLSDGNILVAYADEIGGSNRFRIRGLVIAPDGNLFPGEISFNFARSIDEDDFDITALANNHVAVVVEVAKGDDDIEIESGLFRVSASAATRVDSTAHRVNGIRRNEIFGPTITRDDGIDYRIHHARKRAGQHTVRHTGNEGGAQIDDTRVTDKASFRIVLDSSTLENGNVVVVYDPDGDRGRDDKGVFFFEVLDEDGEIVVAGSSSSTLSQDDGTPSFSRNPTFDPVVNGLKSNRFVIARPETDKNARNERIVMQLFNANGTSVAERTVGDRSTFPDQNEPTIAALDDGGFIVFYDQDRSGDFRIRGQRFDSAGVPVGEDFTVANENGFQLDATGLRNGQAAICYRFASNVKLAILDASSDEARIEASTSDTPALAGA